MGLFFAHALVLRAAFNLRRCSIMPLPEIMQHLRAQYERGAVVPSVQSYKLILARNDDFFISDFPPNKWQTDYERRKCNLSCGFFSVNTLPYKSCGEMRHLDCYELIKERLRIMTANCPLPVRLYVGILQCVLCYYIFSSVTSGTLPRGNLY